MNRGEVDLGNGVVADEGLAHFVGPANARLPCGRDAVRMGKEALGSDREEMRCVDGFDETRSAFQPRLQELLAIGDRPRFAAWLVHDVKTARDDSAEQGMGTQRGRRTGLWLERDRFGAGHTVNGEGANRYFKTQ